MCFMFILCHGHLLFWWVNTLVKYTSYLRQILGLYFWSTFTFVMAATFLGAVMTRTPSEERLDTTSSALASLGRVYFLEKLLATILLPSSALSSCRPSTQTTPLSTVILSSSGLYWAVSRLTSILLSSSLVRINSLSMLLNRSGCLSGALREGSIHLRGNIQPSSYRALLSCLARLLASSLLSSLPSSIPGSSMMLFFMQALSRKSSSKRFHMSLLSLNMTSRTLSKSSHDFLKKGSSKKKSLMVTGTLASPAIFASLPFACLVSPC